MNIYIHDAPMGRFLGGTAVDKNLLWRGNIIEEIYKSINRALRAGEEIYNKNLFIELPMCRCVLTDK